MVKGLASSLPDLAHPNQTSQAMNFKKIGLGVPVARRPPLVIKEAGGIANFHEKVFRGIYRADPFILMETTKMSWTTVGTWVAVLAVIGIVLGGIRLSSLTDPGVRDAEYSSGKEAVSPGVPP
jgi:hypothetical protein